MYNVIGKFIYLTRFDSNHTSSSHHKIDVYKLSVNVFIVFKALFIYFFSKLFLENWSLRYLYTHCSPKSGCSLREFFQGQNLGSYVVTCDDHKNFKISLLHWQLLYLRHTMLHDLGELQKGFLLFSNMRLSLSFSHKTINVTLK